MKIRQITIRKCEYENPKLNRFIYKNIQNRFILFNWNNLVKYKFKLLDKLTCFGTMINHCWNDTYKERIKIKDLGNKYRIILKLPNKELEVGEAYTWYKKPKFHWGREIKAK